MGVVYDARLDDTEGMQSCQLRFVVFFASLGGGNLLKYVGSVPYPVKLSRSVYPYSPSTVTRNIKKGRIIMCVIYKLSCLQSLITKIRISDNRIMLNLMSSQTRATNIDKRKKKKTPLYV